MKEDKKLKRFLVLQSLCPLFLLVFIKHVGRSNLIIRFMTPIFHGDWTVVGKVITNPALGDVIITLISVLWFLITVIVAIGVWFYQFSDYSSHGEFIIIGQVKKDSSVTYFVTYILPLMMDDVSTLSGFIFFLVLLGMVIYLLVRSDLFYQNPVLVALGYKIYEFKFITPYPDVAKDKTYIGLTKGELPFSDKTIKRKYIADDVFFVKNDEGQGK